MEAKGPTSSMNEVLASQRWGAEGDSECSKLVASPVGAAAPNTSLETDGYAAAQARSVRRPESLEARGG